MNSVFEKPEWRHPIRTLKLFFAGLKWARQRAMRGYCDRDTWGVSDWFLTVLPCMIESIQKNRSGFPTVLQRQAWEEQGLSTFDEYLAAPDEIRALVDERADEKWGEILSRLIFLLREANEDTCSRTNPYEQEHRRICKEFREKYGEWGEKLLLEEAEGREKETEATRVFFPSDVPEYKAICDLYLKEEKKMHDYMVQCKDQALQLFSEYFYQLWI